MAKTTGFSFPPRCITTSPRPGRRRCADLRAQVVKFIRRMPAASSRWAAIDGKERRHQCSAALRPGQRMSGFVQR